MQFLHRSAEGRLVVVSVLVVEGRENLAFRKIIERLLAGVGGSIADPKILMNTRDLLPELGTYIRYSSSLTSAPCTEDVDWFVMSQPVLLSEGQIARVRDAVGDNARDTQPRNGRYLQSAQGNSHEGRLRNLAIPAGPAEYGGLRRGFGG
ncbi:MAG: carbonic anhydrase family protein [Alphaproteobacteria bacterium]